MSIPFEIPSAPIPPDTLAEATPVVRTPSELLTEWDERLQNLWHPGLSVALLFAEELYAMEADEMAFRERADYLSNAFWRVLVSREKVMPDTALARYHAVLTAVWMVLKAVRQSVTAPFVEEYLAVALRPVRRLHAGPLTPQVCAALYDYHRGLWTPHLTRPQLWTIRVALAKTIAALPPDDMDAFWECLASPEPMMRHAMLVGLEFLRSAHAVPHLLRGLEQIQDHDTRAAIVDCLEQIADPRAIATLTRLRRETANSDWTLARHIGRALRVIEQQNRGQNHRLLLRPSTTPPDGDRALLRPAADTQESGERHADESALLLRSTDKP